MTESNIVEIETDQDERPLPPYLHPCRCWCTRTMASSTSSR
jgi:hypothetical protein